MAECYNPGLTGEVTFSGTAGDVILPQPVFGNTISPESVSIVSQNIDGNSRSYRPSEWLNTKQIQKISFNLTNSLMADFRTKALDLVGEKLTLTDWYGNEYSCVILEYSPIVQESECQQTVTLTVRLWIEVS